ncbi:unnamed protein product, partial [Symbiodinium sp. KB8]
MAKRCRIPPQQIIRFMSMQLEITTMAGFGITCSVDPEVTVLNLKKVAESEMKRLIKHLITADAQVASESQNILDAGIRDGDMLQAVLMSDDDKVQAIVQERESHTCDCRKVTRAGDYALVKAMFWPRDQEAAPYVEEHFLYHLPSWRRGDAPLLEATYLDDPENDDAEKGHELVLVGNGEVELREVSEFGVWNTLFRKKLDSLLEGAYLYAFTGMGTVAMLTCQEENMDQNSCQRNSVSDLSLGQKKLDELVVRA